MECITPYRDKPLKPFKPVDPVKIDAGVTGITEKEGEILEVRHGDVDRIILREECSKVPENRRESRNKAWALKKHVNVLPQVIPAVPGRGVE